MGGKKSLYGLKKKSIKRNLLVLIVVFLVVIMFASIQAELIKLCLTNDQTIEFSKLCNPNMPDRTCDKTRCEYCIKKISSGVFCQHYPITDCSGECVDLEDLIDFETLSIKLIKPGEIYSGQEEKIIEFEFEVSDPLKTRYCDLYINNEKKATKNPVTKKVMTLESFLNYGTHNWYIECTMLDSPKLTSQTRTLSITEPVYIFLNSPENDFNSTEQKIKFDFGFSEELELEKLSDCFLKINQEKNEFEVNGYNNEIELSLDAGNYSWNVECNYDDSLISSYSRDLFVCESDGGNNGGNTGGGSSSGGGSSGGGTGGGGGTTGGGSGGGSGTLNLNESETNETNQSKEEQVLKDYEEEDEKDKEIDKTSEGYKSLITGATIGGALRENRNSLLVFFAVLIGIFAYSFYKKKRTQK